MSNKITIDGKEYDVESWSESVKNNIVSLQFVENEIQRLQAQLAVFQTARLAYANAVKEGLPPISDSDTIQFN